MRGRPRKSAEQRKLEGTFRVDRHGGNGIEPKGDPIKPAYLSGSASELWDSVTPELIRLGIATEVDSSALATLCEWWQEYRNAADERTKDQRGLAELAEAVSNIAVVLSTNGADAAADVAEGVLNQIGKAVESSLARDRSRVTRMKAAYSEFSRIAARFGLTPMDRRAMRDVDSGSKDDDPLMTFLKKRNSLAS